MWLPEEALCIRHRILPAINTLKGCVCMKLQRDQRSTWLDQWTQMSINQLLLVVIRQKRLGYAWENKFKLSIHRYVYYPCLEGQTLLELHSFNDIIHWTMILWLNVVFAPRDKPLNKFFLLANLISQFKVPSASLLTPTNQSLHSTVKPNMCPL